MTDCKILVSKAYEAQKNSYSPYSGFQVGAALESKDGEIFLGCNVESATYSPTNCAERTAFFKAVSEGVREFNHIAIVGNKKDANPEEIEYCPPCGVCLQVMAEFCNPKTFKITIARSLDDYKTYVLADLLPFSFSKEIL